MELSVHRSRITAIPINHTGTLCSSPACKRAAFMTSPDHKTSSRIQSNYFSDKRNRKKKKTCKDEFIWDWNVLGRPRTERSLRFLWAPWYAKIALCHLAIIVANRTAGALSLGRIRAYEYACVFVCVCKLSSLWRCDCSTCYRLSLS